MSTTKKVAVASAVLILLGGLNAPVFAQAVTNGSFENNAVPAFPGYGSITNWTVSDVGRIGLNNNVTGPFANNGTIPDGSQVAFLQYTTGAGTLAISQTISGLTTGQEYALSLSYNARAGVGTAGLALSLDGGATTVFTDPIVTPVGGTNSYYFETVQFTATTTSVNLWIRNTSTAVGDNALLVDNVSLTVVPEPSALTLVGVGLVGLMVVARRKK